MVYCHDLYGLGNMRRMLQYCHYLRAAFPQASLLFMMGSSQISLFSVPAGLDYIKLPEISRGRTGVISARTLDLEVARVVSLRTSILREAAEAFQPDVLVIDKKPLGAMGELETTLRGLPRTCTRILVSRDILDTPERTIADMQGSGFCSAIRAHIDQIQVLGEQDVFDFGDAYKLPRDIANRLVYTGYAAPNDPVRSRNAVLSELGLDTRRDTVLVTVGGGEDGQSVLEQALAFAEGVTRGPQMILLTGPNLPCYPREHLNRRADRIAHLRMIRSSSDVASLIDAADAVVSMAGYNSVCGILAAGKPMVLLPRTEPSKEQLVRASMLHQRGLAIALAPDAGAEAFEWALRTVLKSARPMAPAFRFDHASNVRRIADGILRAMSENGAPFKGRLPCSA